MRIVSTLLLFLLILSAVQAFMAYPELPDPMASHFSGSGEPDGWSSRAFFFGLCGALDVLMVGIFLGAPYLLRRLPVSLINMPNKEYWFADERRDESVRALGGMLGWVGVATLLLMLLTKQLVIRVNLDPEVTALSDAFLWVLGGYLSFIVVWIVVLYRSFRIPPSTN